MRERLPLPKGSYLSDQGDRVIDVNPDDFGSPLEVTHLCPPGDSGTMPCCGKTPFEVPRSDRMSVHLEYVTCGPA